ncbi:MipA/OmpV family protein [Novosphingobium sp. Gsoil 351]|uniref:MipA/OmpV family protein n=1 Tax=Novosphingobium sp. Gsoil 351 TaxID=2675225 RepID=UPI001E2C44AD|nr:MipA/OmpV family protein [Novosphingobium sp. Gsoil 351]
MRRTILLAAAFAALTPTLVHAQNDGPQTDTVFDGDYLTVGVGGFYGPSYEGSDDYVLFPAPVIQGRLLGVAITPRPGGIALDFIPDAKDAKVGFSLGPVANIRRDRVSKIKDPVVKRLGKLETAVEVGGNAGVTVYDVVTGYDSLTVSADARWDVAGAHKGMLWGPSISYFTPVSKGVAVNLAISAEHMDRDYADYYFTVSPTGAVASALPTFQAKGGWKNVGVNALVGVDFDGDLTNGGLAGFVTGGYTKLLGDAKRTPLTSIRGDADQWLVGAGLAFTF